MNLHCWVRTIKKKNLLKHEAGLWWCWIFLIYRCNTSTLQRKIWFEMVKRVALPVAEIPNATLYWSTFELDQNDRKFTYVLSQLSSLICLIVLIVDTAQPLFQMSFCNFWYMFSPDKVANLEPWEFCNHQIADRITELIHKNEMYY